MMSAPAAKAKRRNRAIVITPRGRAILAAIDRGGYRFDTRSDQVSRGNATRARGKAS